MNTTKPKIIVFGSPYCGAQYISKVLCHLGFEVGFEVPGKDGIVSWKYSQYPPEDPRVLGYSIKWHLTRHPLMCLTGYKEISTDVWHGIGNLSKQVGLDWWPHTDSSEKRCLLFWLYWHTFAERLTSFRFQVEQLPLVWPELLTQLKLPLNTPLPQVPVTTNRKDRKVVWSWDQWYLIDAELTIQVLELAKRYGYTQLPYHYLRDSFYEFPEQILLTRATSPCT